MYVIGCITSFSDTALTVTVEANDQEVELEFSRDVAEGVAIRFGAPITLSLRDGAPVIQPRELRPVRQRLPGEQEIDRWINSLS